MILETHRLTIIDRGEKKVLVYFFLENAVKRMKAEVDKAVREGCILNPNSSPFHVTGQSEQDVDNISIKLETQNFDDGLIFHARELTAYDSH
jgi:hypothetical protein